MKRTLLIFGIAFGMNADVAVAQHENKPGHEKMPPGEHAKHNKKKGEDAKKDGDADKKQPPASNDPKSKGPKQK